MVSGITDHPGEEAGVVGRRTKMHVGKDGCNFVVPVPGRSTKPVESSVEEPQLILLIAGVADR